MVCSKKGFIGFIIIVIFYINNISFLSFTDTYKLYQLHASTGFWPYKLAVKLSILFIVICLSN